MEELIKQHDKECPDRTCDPMTMGVFMSQCEGDEVHEHFSLETGTFIEHKHKHDCRSIDFNNLHHHPPEDHHLCTEEELHNEERDTGRKIFLNEPEICIC
jgi:hypothetical protein